MDDIICWQPHGRSFQVRKPKDFEQIVMKRFFNQTKISSFRRQLNLYDFKRITHGPDSGSYYHEMFLRGKPLQASKMIRTKVKGTKFRATSSPDAEPNFYTLPFLPPTQNQYSVSSKPDGSATKPAASDLVGPSMRDESDTSKRSHPNVSSEKNIPSRNPPEISTGINMNMVPLLNASGVYAPNHLYQINQLLASSGNLSNISCIQPNMHQNLHLPHALPNANSSSTHNPAFFPSLRNMQMFQQQVDDTTNLGENVDSKSSNLTSQHSNNNSKGDDDVKQVSSQSRGNTIAVPQSRFGNEYGGYDDLQRAILANQLQAHSNPMFGMKLNATDGILTGLRMDHQQKVKSENDNDKKNIATAACNTSSDSSNSASV